MSEETIKKLQDAELCVFEARNEFEPYSEERIKLTKMQFAIIDIIKSVKKSQ